MVASTLHVELDGAAEEVVRVQVTQHHVAVGNRNGVQAAVRPAGADAIASTVRAQLDRLAVRVDADEAACTGTDRVHRHQRQRQNQAGHVRVGLDREIALGDQRHVEAGATDVGASNVLVAESFAEHLRTDHAADRAGHDGAGQFLGLPADRAAVRSHHAQIELAAVLLEAVADQLQRGTRRFCAVGFQNRRVHAVAFLARWVVIHRSKHRNVDAELLQLFLDDVTSALLAGTVLVRLQQADHDGLRTGLDQFLGRNANFVFAQWNHDLALNVGTLGNTAGARDRHQGRIVAVGVQVDTVFQCVAEVALQRTTHRVDLLEAAVAHQTHVETLAAQNAVQHCGTGVDAGHQLRVNVVDLAAPVRQSVD